MSERPMVVDSHVHFWDPAALRYPWLEKQPELERAFLPPDYFLRDAIDADAVIFVEANCDPRDATSEVQFVRRLAEVEPRIVAIIAFVNLLDEATRGDTLQQLSANRLVAGVRQNIQGTGVGFCTSASFLDGAREVGELGFVFDVCATADQLEEVEVLVRECGGTQFVLDHCGKPSVRHGAFVRWSEELMRLSAYPNVSCKLSGLLSEARPEQRDDETLLPYAQHVLACFGADRMMYGSDWPVVTAAGSAVAWRAFTDRFTASWDEATRRQFYSGNAIRVYRLDVHAAA